MKIFAIFYGSLWITFHRAPPSFPTFLAISILPPKSTQISPLTLFFTRIARKKNTKKVKTRKKTKASVLQTKMISSTQTGFVPLPATTQLTGPHPAKRIPIDKIKSQSSAQGQ